MSVLEVTEQAAMCALASARASAWAHAPAAFASQPRPLGQHETGTGLAGPGLLSAPRVRTIRT